MGVLEYIKERAFMFAIILAIVGTFGLLLTRDNSTTDAKVASATTPASFSKVDSNSPMSKGSKDADVALIQYSDFLCPSCSYFSTAVMPEIETKYIDTNKVAFEFRPIAFIAEGSQISAEGAYCAIDQDKFWNYHDAIYEYVWTTAFSKGVDPKTTIILTPEIVKNVASTAGIDPIAFDSCLDNGTYTKKVVDTTETAQGQGVVSTPYILVNGQQVKGDVSFTTVDTLIKTQL